MVKGFWESVAASLHLKAAPSECCNDPLISLAAEVMLRIVCSSVAHPLTPSSGVKQLQQISHIMVPLERALLVDPAS